MEGLPRASDLPRSIKLNMTEEQLLSVNRQNLISFKGAVQQVYNDEKLSTDPNKVLQDKTSWIIQGIICQD